MNKIICKIKSITLNWIGCVLRGCVTCVPKFLALPMLRWVIRTYLSVWFIADICVIHLPFVGVVCYLFLLSLKIDLCLHSYQLSVLSSTFHTLKANLADDKLMIFLFIIFPRKYLLVWHFMWIVSGFYILFVSLGDSSHKMSNPIFWGKYFYAPASDDAWGI